jgi:hypothetical protein
MAGSFSLGIKPNQVIAPATSKMSKRIEFLRELAGIVISYQVILVDIFVKFNESCRNKINKIYERTGFYTANLI